MFRSTVTRVVTGIVLMLAVVVLNFLLIQLAPGDAVDVLIADGGASEEVVQRIRETYGLDEPVTTQLFRYIVAIFHGDLGYSFYFNKPVTDVILEALPVTIMLGLAALFLSSLLGTVLGVAAALRPNHMTSHLVTFISLIGYATPTFWFGMMMLIAFASWLPLFPAYGLTGVPPPREFLPYALDVAYHLVLPAVTLAGLFLASISRLSRASMLEVLNADYIRTAEAKGLTRSSVIYKHALRNAAIPIVTMIGLQLGQLLSGAVLVETVFSLPGIGPLLFESVLRRDYPVMLGILLISAGMVIFANILTDLTYRLIDPRIGGRSRAR
jgi:peptide/nickel transport system permease protein